MNCIPTIVSVDDSAQLRVQKAGAERHQDAPFLPGVRSKPLINFSPGKKILSIGDDQTLLFTRGLVLESAGFSVHSVSSREMRIRQEIQMFDLVLICHSVEKDQVHSLAESLKSAFPLLPIVLISSGFPASVTAVEESVTAVEEIAPFGPQDLLCEVTAILQSINQPQIYGTQYLHFNHPPVTQQPYATDLISDSIRSNLGVPTLKEQEERLKRYQQQLAAPEKKP